jgi:hypothetical protein
MSATATKRPPTPKALQKRKITLAQATATWAETTRAMEGLKGLRDEAATVLLEHAERTGRRTYGDQIAVQPSGGSLVLDQEKVRDYLGARLRDFQRRTKHGLTLKLLK